VKAGDKFQPANCKLSFCCNSRSNGKIQPYYWLATDHNKDKKKTNLQQGKEKLKERRIGKDYEQNKHKASNSVGGQR
jgi:hypothetical protein